MDFTLYENRPLDTFVSDNIDILKRMLQDFKLFDFAATNLTGKPAYKVVYTYRNGQDHLETTEFFSVVGNTGYTIKYLSTIGNYPKYLQTALKVVSSLDLYKVTRNLTVPGLRSGIHPLGLAVDPNKAILYVVNRDSRTVSAIDASTDRILANVSVGRFPVAVTVNPNTRMLYVIDSSSGTTSAIDGSTNKVAAYNIPTGHIPVAVTIDPINNLVFVANSGSGTVSVISGLEQRVIANITVGGTPVGVAVNPFTKMAYVSNEDNNVSVIDYSLTPARTFEKRNVTDIPLGSYLNGVAIDPKTNMVYVTTYNDTLLVINASTNKVVARPLVGPSPNYVAVNPNTNMVYVTNSNGSLSVLSASTNRVVSTVEIGVDPAAVVVNPDNKLIYVSHPSFGTISVINATTNNVVDGISFNINPQGSGDIACGRKISSNNYLYTISGNNYLRFIVGTSLNCVANHSPGFKFSSWSGSLASSSNLNSTTLTFYASKYGDLTASFDATPPPVVLPKGALDTIYALIVGVIITPIASWIIPYIVDRRDTARQRKYLGMYLQRIDKINEESYPSREEYLKLLGEKRKDTTRLLEEGVINDSTYQILDGRISEYIDMIKAENISSASASNGFVSNISKDSEVQKRIQKYTSDGKPSEG